MKTNYFRAASAFVGLSALLCLGYAGSTVGAPSRPATAGD